MVDWDRVDELRSKGWDWERIASDAKVGFHPEASVREPGRALRALYHRQRSRQRRQEPASPAAAKKAAEVRERRWSLVRVGYLLTPIFGVWFAVAYLDPAQAGLLVPAIPYLALVLVVAAFLLVFGLWRSSGARWTKVFRSTVVVGVVVGLVVSAVIALGAALFFGCPYLPPPSAGTSQPSGWTSFSVPAWHDQGRPVVYYYGATWCPYCSASSWAIWKALIEFGSITGNYTGYSSAGDVYPSTPEMVLANVQMTSTNAVFQVNEDTSGNDGSVPATSNCVQQAYLNTYSGGSIPFLVVNGQYVHGGATLVNPAYLQNYAGSGASAVLQSVYTETGTPWTVVQGAAWWVMAYMAKASGETVSALAAQYHWTTATANAVSGDLAQIH